MARKTAYQTRFHNRAAITLVLLTVFAFIAVLSVNCYSLNEKKEKLLTQQTKLEEELAQEQQEALDLQEFEKTTQTMKYYEQIAKEKLGMVYKDEIIFKEND